MRYLESKDVENPVVAYADRLGVVHTKMNIRGNRGWPDDIFWIPGGKPLIMEFKREGEDLEPLQAYRFDHLKRLKYDVHKIDTAEEGIALLDKRLKQRLKRVLSRP